MNVLVIAIPFFISSFLSKFFSDKIKSEELKSKSYNKLLLVSLLIAIICSNLISKELVLEKTSFALSLVFFYFSNYATKKSFKYLFSIIGYFLFIPILYFNVGIINTMFILLITFALLFYLKNHIQDLAYICSIMLPLGFVGLYLASNQILFPIIFMTFFGSIRYFIENKKAEINIFILQAFCLILMLLIGTIPFKESFSSNFVLLSGFSFIILDLINKYILKNDNYLITRLYQQDEFKVVSILRIVSLNVISMALFTFVKLNYLNIYIALISIILIALIFYIFIWYKENEYLL